MEINIEKLKEDLLNEALGMFFGAGIGAGLIEASQIESASGEELIEIAKEMNINIHKYVIK